MKIVIFTGAGISKESGIETFRDSVDGLWNNHRIDDVATKSAWGKDRAKVLDFYNERRQQLPSVEPNDAHRALVELEKHFEVTIVTQNVDDLHERAGSSNILHLHGELTKARGSFPMSTPNNPNQTVIDIGYDDINIGDRCLVSDSQLRPHIVWFEEYPFYIDEAYTAMFHADILLVIGTSLQIGYTLTMINEGMKESGRVIYIDPDPRKYLDNYGLDVEYIKETAVNGVVRVVNELINNNK
jgi:NAD-dependent deacetylase